MPAIIAACMQGLRWLLMSRLGLIIASAMLWLGINLATVNLVLEPLIDQLRGFADSTGSGGGSLYAAARAWAGVLRFDQALTMVISAYVTKHAVMAGRLYLFKRGVGA